MVFSSQETITGCHVEGECPIVGEPNYIPDNEEDVPPLTMLSLQLKFSVKEDNGCKKIKTFVMATNEMIEMEEDENIPF